MLLKSKRAASARAALLLTLLLPGCASVSPPLQPLPVSPPAIPALPLAARQPPTLQECSPTCSDGARREFDSWLTSPTSAAAPASSASAPTTR